ncbi:unnamed protein product [Ectocarpus sp. CCAP 1310/34]|nr:unnamed protein product [Ectocarpus sp. CCAP 1310/34]
MSSMDRAALIALFHSTDGANWKRKRNWNTEAGLATWEGVRLNHAGRVVELALPNNNLHGSIPEALGALSELKNLVMSNNKLTGSVPRELGGLGKLEQLGLDGNELTGSIPGELGGLGKVQFLRLDGNKLTGSIPEALGALSEVKVLYLHDNKLTGEAGWRAKIDSFRVSPTR